VSVWLGELGDRDPESIPGAPGVKCNARSPVRWVPTVPIRTTSVSRRTTRATLARGQPRGLRALPRRCGGEQPNLCVAAAKRKFFALVMRATKAEVS
jgi:hypothetical protein